MAKEPKDILDENVIERLNAANPTNRDIAEGLKLVIRMLWSKEQLEEYIERKLEEKCANCELKAQGAQLPAACAAVQDEAAAPAVLTRRHVMIAVVKAPWFWLVVATACAVVCSYFGISLPTVGGGQ